MKERSLVIIKPDAVARGLTEEVIFRIESAGFKIIARQDYLLPRKLVEEHYVEHQEKIFYGGLVAYLTSSPVTVLIAEGKNAILGLRKLAGPTNPAEAPAGTIRGDLKGEKIRNEDNIILNLIHASDSAESAEREIKLFFADLTIPMVY